MEYSLPIMLAKGHTPPLALITIAALLPPRWRVRLIDRAFQEMRDQDILQADLVMISAMHTQRTDVRAVLSHCRRLGRRTIIGGLYANIQPDALLPFADHVVVGEVDDSFARIAADFEAGRARRLYRIADKPDVSHSPVPRFDILDIQKYVHMSLQFSRGCPFQCEFCDIPGIYGRRPRTKTAEQVVAELETLYRLGWRGWVGFADDNFIGNHRAALQLARELARWQKDRQYPFAFATEASIDLSERLELMDSMAEANFLNVFIGIETPSAASLRETKKSQNLRQDTLEQIRLIQSRGIWVSAGFIVGFDADDEQIFDRQVEFIEHAPIPWAMINILQAIPTTPLYDRLQIQERLIENDVTFSAAGALPNFRTRMPLDILLKGVTATLHHLYEPEHYFRRTIQSLERWAPAPVQHSSRVSILYLSRIILRSFWFQGWRSDYRLAYWRFVALIMKRWWHDSTRIGLALIALISAHHFFRYARQLARALEEDRQTLRGSTNSDACSKCTAHAAGH